MELLVAFARQWVAGLNLEDALDRARERNSSGIGAILNHLGEHYQREEEVQATVSEYDRIIDAIKGHGLDACVSIKLSQFGLAIDEAYCRRTVDRLLERCEAEGIFLWLDMEGSEYTSRTLRIYEECLERYQETGVALQANLRRTEEDLRFLLPKGGIIRLCKGAYREDPSISYRRRADVDESYRRLMRILFEEGDRFALATHDDRMIQEGLALQDQYDRQLEFQMLLGVRDELKDRLRSMGQRVLEYIPYGPKWLPYFLRRLRERPRNVILMARSFVSG